MKAFDGKFRFLVFIFIIPFAYLLIKGKGAIPVDEFAYIFPLSLVIFGVINLSLFINYYNSNVLEFGDRSREFYYNQPDIKKKIKIYVWPLNFAFTMVFCFLIFWGAFYIFVVRNSFIAFFLASLSIGLILIIGRVFFEKRNDYISYSLDYLKTVNDATGDPAKENPDAH